MAERLRILLTEGSSLSARQTLYALGPAGHTIDILDPRPWFCLGRFSRFVRAVHACPPFAVDPQGYLRVLVERLKAEPYDVLFPSHDQAYLLSRFRESLRKWTGLAVPDFDAMEKLQSKAGMVRLLNELNVPCPPTKLVKSRHELVSAADFPCFIKLAHSTAGCGVWRIENRDELATLAERLEKTGNLTGQEELLVQQPAPGSLSVVQSVFQHGRLVGAHCYQARAQGVGGSAWARISVSHPMVIEHVARIGAHLGWHGALMFDYIYDPVTDTPRYIDCNPRIGETFNAMLSGVNLCEQLLQVSLDQPVKPQPPARQGVQTHNLTMRLMALAQETDQRRTLLRELVRFGSRRGHYAGSCDEQTQPGRDFWSLLPAAFLTVQLLLRPGAAGRIITGAVSSYALSDAAVRRIREEATVSDDLSPVS